MNVLQQYHIAVFPKMFNIINFYSKGLYRMEISVTAVDEKCNKVKAFPCLVESKDTLKAEEKRPKTEITQDKFVYLTQSFYVTFSTQTFNLNSICNFKLQLQRQKTYKVYIDFRLLITTFRRNKKQPSKISQQKGHQTSSTKKLLEEENSIQSSSHKVDTKRLYLNSLDQYHTFHRVLFNEPDYFSYSDIYLHSFKVSEKLVPFNKITLGNFYLMTIEERIKHTTMIKGQILDKFMPKFLCSNNTKQLKEVLTLFGCLDVAEVYQLLVAKPANVFKSVAQLYQHFRAMMVTLNNSTIAEQIQLPFFEPLTHLTLQYSARSSNSLQQRQLSENQAFEQDNSAQLTRQYLIKNKKKSQQAILSNSYCNPQQNKQQKSNNRSKKTFKSPIEKNFQRLEKLFEYYESQNQTQLIIQIIQESFLIEKNIKWLLQNFLNLIVGLNFNVFSVIANGAIYKKIEEKLSKFVFEGNIEKEKKSKHSAFLALRKLYVEKEPIVEEIDFKHPFIMLEKVITQPQRHSLPQLNKNVTQNSNSSMRNKKDGNFVTINNLVILVHGYQGSDFDLQMARYTIQMQNSHSHCLISSSIQDDMDQSIQFLGRKLAQQIKQHIHNSYNVYSRINFVGYSLGGIIIRESLKYLAIYRQKLNLFISLASPHVGIIDCNNFLIKTGIWYLINFEKAKNLKQLNCQTQSVSSQSQQYLNVQRSANTMAPTTNSNTKEQIILLKKLSECQSIGWFEKVIVVSSEQDSFVPYNSSRLDQLGSSQLTKVMCENIKKRIKKLERVEVWFDMDSQIGTLDRLLGRRAHIEFLENKIFLRVLFKLYAPEF